MTAENPAIFIVGCPRSGTTLLQRMLDHHPELAVTNDTHFIPRALDGIATGDVALSTQLVDRVVTYRRFHRMGLSEETARRLSTGATTYGQYVSLLYDEVARRSGKPLAGEKTPDYVRCLPLLGSLFPWAPVLHIIRDGRDVALSVREWARDGKGPSKLPLWDDDPLGTAAMWWRWQVETGREDAARLPALHYREIRYESLVADPEAALRGLARFAGLKYSSEMLGFHEGRTRYGSTLSAKSAWLPPTPGLRDWRTDLTSDQLAWFEALTGDLLSELGYERAFPDPTQPLVERAARFHTLWYEQIRRRNIGARTTEESDPLRSHSSA